ncbi:hypothetical protein F5148DRAFT_648859 [Russula earlei]|uniref:Uncharacterized protein n=1 Tax=Russula earlei TaxID=71964 RepID=A0ACC0UNP5_9AGAM|nr:hypothetical protein F5148DRAFT_648859 [Russula earlei]
MQRSQSTPNVSVRPSEQPLQRPRRTTTSIDFSAVLPRSATHRETRVDPFNLAGFFPAGLRQSDEEPTGWWRDEGPEEGSDELVRELVMVNSDTNSLSFQHALFNRENEPSKAVVKREDKPGALTVSVTGGRPRWVDGTDECLHSPYISDEACDDEALRLAYERRRYQLMDGSSGQLPEKTRSLFYEGEEEEEAAGWFGLMSV